MVGLEMVMRGFGAEERVVEAEAETRMVELGGEVEVGVLAEMQVRWLWWNPGLMEALRVCSAMQVGLCRLVDPGAEAPVLGYRRRVGIPPR